MRFVPDSRSIKCPDLYYYGCCYYFWVSKATLLANKITNQLKWLQKARLLWPTTVSDWPSEPVQERLGSYLPLLRLPACSYTVGAQLRWSQANCLVALKKDSLSRGGGRVIEHKQKYVWIGNECPLIPHNGFYDGHERMCHGTDGSVVSTLFTQRTDLLVPLGVCGISRTLTIITITTTMYWAFIIHPPRTLSYLILQNNPKR